MADPSSPGAPSGVELDVVVAAPPGVVWRAIVDPARAPEWMGGFRFECTWEIGGSLAICGVLNGKRYEERGTLRAFEPGARLRYDHWSRLWRVPDLPENRAVLELRLRPEGQGTRVTLRHDLPPVTALREHSAYFWGVALAQLKVLVERAGDAR